MMIAILAKERDTKGNMINQSLGMISMIEVLKYKKKDMWVVIAAPHEPCLLGVSLLRGIVIGGGAGPSIHGRFRVVTDNTVFAMPETALGLFLDVGASYYLSRLPGFFGVYVGLTGARLDGAEMLACGTHFVPLEKLSLLEDALCKANTGDPKVISNIIDEINNDPDTSLEAARRVEPYCDYVDINLGDIFGTSDIRMHLTDSGNSQPKNQGNMVQEDYTPTRQNIIFKEDDNGAYEPKTRV